MREAIYKDGVPDELATTWYINGQKEFEATLKDGEYDGLVIEWYENGQKMSKVTFKDYNQIEPKIDFDKNGEKRNGNWTLITDKVHIKGTSIKGKRHGKFKSYNKDGMIDRITVYKKGFLHGDEKSISIDENGNKTYMLTNWKKGEKGETSGPFPFQ